MLDISKESYNNNLIIKVHGQLTPDDYTNVFVTRAEQLIAQYEKINILLEFCSDFSRWQLAAIWDDIKFYFKHRNDIAKLGIIGDSEWTKWSSRHILPYIDGQYEVFTRGQKEKARAWLYI